MKTGNKDFSMMDEAEKQKYLRARKRVQELKKFYNNLTAYIIFVFFFALINYWDNQWRYPWFLWAALGWGIGVAFHAMKAFHLNPMYSENWEKRKLKEFMDKEEQESQQMSQKRWE